MKYFIPLLISIASLSASCQNKKMDTKEQITVQPSSVHSFSVKGLDGETIDFSRFKGKKILIVNTASECGYTPQYKDLQELYENNKEKLVVVGFPSNDFGGQEPGSAAEIMSFCSKNYQVSFPMAEKVRIKGDDAAPIYQWLTKKELNGVADAKVSWNFNKFLLDENGFLLDHFGSNTSPLDKKLLQRIRE